MTTFASLWYAKGETDWEKQVIKAVQEVLSHPLGGRVAVVIYAQDKPGDRRVVILPSMNGITKKTIELTMRGD